MAYWGIAYASGPNYNKAWGIFDRMDLETSMQTCYQASRRADKLAHPSEGATTTPEEKAIARAIKARYPVVVRAKNNRRMPSTAEM
ncbi:hypothetical protein I317_04058 [Kwoniella heveanensis CBS 569]|nr:hypothetical protein I317_04058 [Kwoniella heveanensis CBS 569]